MGQPSSAEASVSLEGLMGNSAHAAHKVNHDRLEKGPQSPGSARHQETILRGSRAARRGGGAGRGEHCEENPELSPKVATSGIHYPSGDVFIASVSHSWAPRWEQLTAGASSNSHRVWAAHPAPHNRSPQASPPGLPHTSPGPWSRPSTILGHTGARVFFRMLHFLLQQQCQSTASPCHATSPGSAPPCPPMPTPLGKASPEQGVSPHDD